MRWNAVNNYSNFADGTSNKFIEDGERHFKNLRQLTFSGENAEAYFSPDSKELIFQAHDGEGKCDQIYTMDLKTGEIKMVSTGKGVTTCAFFLYPNKNKFVYASTHHKMIIVLQNLI